MSTPTMQTALRFPTDWLSRIDEIAGQMAPLGNPVSRSTVMRLALGRGLDVLAGELAELAPAPKAAETVAEPATKQAALFSEPVEPAKVQASPRRGPDLHARLAAAKAAGHSQTDIARAIGLDPGQLSRWNTGKGSLNETRLADLAAHLDGLGF